MAEYIDRETALKAVELLRQEPEIDDADAAYNDALIDCRNYIANIPAADVAPVVHAGWERDDKIRCSNCGMPTTDLRLEPSVVDYDQATFAVNVYAHPYCGFCGAKMDE